MTQREHVRSGFVDAAETGPAEVINSARTLPFLGTRRLIIVRDVHKWTVEQWEKVTSSAASPTPSTCLVLTTEKVDKRRAWWKAKVAAPGHWTNIIPTNRPSEICSTP